MQTHYDHCHRGQLNRDWQDVQHQGLNDVEVSLLPIRQSLNDLPALAGHVKGHRQPQQMAKQFLREHIDHASLRVAEKPAAQLGADTGDILRRRVGSDQKSQGVCGRCGD